MLSFIRRRKNSFFIFWAILSLLFCFIVVIPQLSDIPIVGIHSFLYSLLQFIIISFFASSLLLALASSRWLFVILFPPVMLLCGILTFLKLTIGVTLNPLSLEATLVSDIGNWHSFISWQLVICALTALLIGIFFSFYRFRYISLPPRKTIILFLIGLIISSIPNQVSSIQRFVGERLPFSIFYSVKGYLANRSQIMEVRTTYDSIPAAAAHSSPDIIFILGEALRADHLPANGYERDVTPYLSKLPNLISFSDIYTPLTFTDGSVSYILTETGPENIETRNDRQSFISLFKKAGYNTAWLANQNLSRGYAYFAHEADSLIYVNSGHTIYNYSKWLDADMLPHLQDLLSHYPAESKNLFILHTIGQHWWYKSHYTDRHARFLPEASHKEITRLSREEIVNSYDNSILATDEFIYDVYQLIKSRNAIIFYISDHGELLGENGKYLHASDEPAAHNPACFIIYTDRYKATHPEIISGLDENSRKPFDTETIFHSILSIGEIDTPACDPSKSMNTVNP